MVVWSGFCLLFISIHSLFFLASSDILRQYAALSDTIKEGLVQTVIDNDFIAFNTYVADLLMDTSKSQLLFQFIGRTATPKSSYGLAFGQFETRKSLLINDERFNIPFESEVMYRNIRLSNSGSLRFTYAGIYRVCVQFRSGSSTSEFQRWTFVRMTGVTSGEVVGRSVTGTSGGYGEFSVDSYTFLASIYNINDLYTVQIVRDESSQYTIQIAYDDTWMNSVTVSELPTANVMVTIENIASL
eukprot:CAMPEP_0202701358 /NCGR_PEP_ID=MMETSP1385-20130828/14458_1 /ASSEMBLY_ACC=CAM_ASM_000861 /TAXON_ID=933848 /ORGANISM="Elphidium margaritaceum" /LENGTH=242 /DNA_ID=CAMNT_0049358763 /DNA_START=26 /DNA_END=754 /DNA_ORIENTATION=-